MCILEAGMMVVTLGPHLADTAAQTCKQEPMTFLPLKDA